MQERGMVFIHFAISNRIEVWIAALLTLAVFSYLYKDNPLFKLVEHLFAGVASAYVFCTQWHDVVKPKLIDPALSSQTPALEKGLLLIPFFLCLCMLSRVVPKWAWLSRWALAFIIGFYAGTNIPHYLETSVVKQVEATLNRPLIAQADGVWQTLLLSADNIVFILGIITVLSFFYFSLPHTGKIGKPLGTLSTVGRYFMMVAFGATFANAVMGRVSVLIGSLDLLLRDWLEWIA